MRYIPLTLFAILAVTGNAQEQAIKSAPKLVVNITIDQFRSDYMEAFAPLYDENGFKRLLNGGIVYT
ncbi:MAG: alkaline phosphatase family protein, partial [Prevotella sp.]|nr:alkaline phosphatase family protein [Prevotella sp.]